MGERNTCRAEKIPPLVILSNAKDLALSPVKPDPSEYLRMTT
jgi:hypothetical protein